MNKKLPRYIYFCGPDGAGKSTQIKLLTNFFSRNGHIYQYRYFRYPRIFTRLILFFGKILDYTSYERYGEINLWYHEFYKSKMLSKIYPIMFLIDLLIIWNLSKVNRSRFDYIILDRFVIDILVDISLETNRPNIFKEKIGKIFLGIIPPKTKIIMLNADYVTIKKRREDLQFDKWLNKRIERYFNIQNIQDMINIAATLEPDEIHKTIIAEIRTDK